MGITSYRSKTQSREDFLKTLIQKDNSGVEVEDKAESSQEQRSGGKGSSGRKGASK